MKKSSFAAMLLGTVSIVLFALGMCMAFIQEWNLFKPGIVVGCGGMVLGMVTVLVWRKMEHKEPYFRKNRSYNCGQYHRSVGFGSRDVFQHGMG